MIQRETFFNMTNKIKNSDTSIMIISEGFKKITDLLSLAHSMSKVLYFSLETRLLHHNKHTSHNKQTKYTAMAVKITRLN